jgi:glycosyltransferase involved in cell wall biosynthesis
MTNSRSPFSGEIAVIIGATGPYHLARLNALHQLLSKQGCSLTLVLRNGRISEYPWFDEPDSLPFRVVKAYPERDPEPKFLRSANGMFRALNSFKPDAIVFGMPFPAYFGPFAWGLKNRTPMILFSESKANDSPRSALKERLKRSIYGRFGAAVVGGSPHVEYLSTLGIPKEKCFMGYDAVDNGYFESKAACARKRDQQLREQHGLPERYWIAANRFISKKNLHRLLEAYDLYRQSMGNKAWKLVLIGDGPEKETLLELRTQLGLEQAILFPGLVNYDMLPEFYALAEAFVHASTVEQWGLVANEAMASGLPIIMSEKCGCVSSLLEEGCNGFSFDPFDVESISNAMQRFHHSDKNERIRMGARSEEIIENWGPERFAEAIWAALNAVKR